MIRLPERTAHRLKGGLKIEMWKVAFELLRPTAGDTVMCMSGIVGEDVRFTLQDR